MREGHTIRVISIGDARQSAPESHTHDFAPVSHSLPKGVHCCWPYGWKARRFVLEGPRGPDGVLDTCHSVFVGLTSDGRLSLEQEKIGGVATVAKGDRKRAHLF